MDDDSSVMDDAQYEDYVRGLSVLSEDELTKLLSSNAEIVKLSDEIDALTIKHDASEDATEQGVLDNLIHFKQDQLDQSIASVQDLDDRLRVAEETHYVMGLTGLSDSARQELLTMYETQRDLEKQIARAGRDAERGSQSAAVRPGLTACRQSRHAQRKSASHLSFAFGTGPVSSNPYEDLRAETGSGSLSPSTGQARPLGEIQIRRTRRRI